MDYGPPTTQDAVVALAAARACTQELADSWRIQVLEPHAHLAAALAASRDAERRCRATLDRLALADYQLTGEKQPAPGVTIKVKKSLGYDRDTATAWAQGHGLFMQPAQLDVAAFEKVAASLGVPWVEIRQTPSVSVATDLGTPDVVWVHFLPDAGDTHTSCHLERFQVVVVSDPTTVDCPVCVSHPAWAAAMQDVVDQAVWQDETQRDGGK